MDAKQEEENYGMVRGERVVKYLKEQKMAYFARAVKGGTFADEYQMKADAYDWCYDHLCDTKGMIDMQNDIVAVIEDGAYDCEGVDGDAPYACCAERIGNHLRDIIADLEDGTWGEE